MRDATSTVFIEYVVVCSAAMCHSKSGAGKITREINLIRMYKKDDISGLWHILMTAWEARVKFIHGVRIKKSTETTRSELWVINF